MALGALASTPADMLHIPGGAGWIGSLRGLPDEQPRHQVRIEDFLLDRSPVRVDAFARFVADTGHVSTAEQLGSGAVMQFGSGRWSLLKGATWHHPLGPDQAPAGADHPVTQVSWHDAQAYCAWAGKRLPGEYEWEHAARAGHAGEPVYAFGDRLLREGQYLANVWTGHFPVINTRDDGYALTSPVGHYGVSPIGLTDMAGNVWEWVDGDYHPYPLDKPAPVAADEKVMRGGSFLCDPGVCHAFRVSARGHATPDSSLMHVGFRCARDIAPTRKARS